MKSRQVTRDHVCRDLAANGGRITQSRTSTPPSLRVFKREVTPCAREGSLPFGCSLHCFLCVCLFFFFPFFNLPIFILSFPRPKTPQTPVIPIKTPAKLMNAWWNFCAFLTETWMRRLLLAQINRINSLTTLSKAHDAWWNFCAFVTRNWMWRSCWHTLIELTLGRRTRSLHVEFCARCKKP